MINVVCPRILDSVEYLSKVLNINRDVIKDEIDAAEDEVDFVNKKLMANNIHVWSYAFENIHHIVANNTQVVLVDCMVWNKKDKQFKHVYRWYEVPSSNNNS